MGGSHASNNQERSQATNVTIRVVPREFELSSLTSGTRSFLLPENARPNRWRRAFVLPAPPYRESDSMNKPMAVLAFSGGLDTSFCVPWLQEQGYAVVTVTVDTGGFSAAERAAIEARAAELGVDSPPHARRPAGALGPARDLHHQGQRAARRGLPALRGARAAGAGDAGGREWRATLRRDRDRARLDRRGQRPGALRPGHSRAGARSRHPDPDARPGRPARHARSTSWPSTACAVPAKTGRYSINKGLLGTTIGGGETLNSWDYPPEDAFVDTRVARATRPTRPPS